MKQGIFEKIQSWPFGEVNPDNGRLEYSTNETSLKESILNILLTQPGERIMRPEFGAGLQTFIHQPNSLSTRQIIASTITTAINRWEPRVILETVNVIPDSDDFSRINIELHYQSLQNNNQYSLQFQMNLSN
ncbi:MAG: GPW/gp25 family protein [Gammaproteobacteria bacterium]|nr:GPW/gp25 family protein [Gammaproteobacteria bacterium]